MLETMIQKDPNFRKTANEHLLEQRGQVFPDYFYTFLQSYMQIFSTDPSMTSDHKINKIHENMDAIMLKVENNEFDIQGKCTYQIKGDHLYLWNFIHLSILFFDYRFDYNMRFGYFTYQELEILRRKSQSNWNLEQIGQNSC